MPGNAFVTYYPFDTLDVVPTWGLEQKFTQLAARLKEANSNMKWAASRMDMSEYIGFFAVPEYYFLKRYEMVRGELAIEVYEEQERDALIARLVGLSDQYNRIVIMPGTVNWRKRRAAPITVNRRGAPVQIHYDAFSTAPVLYGGDLIHSYDKVMNDGNLNQVDETQFSPGVGSPVFTVKNLRCGLEICGDFNEKNLSKATGPMSLDFEFMMSASNFHSFSQGDMSGVPLKDGGYFFHVDQKPSRADYYNGVWCVSRGNGWHGVDNSGLGGITFDPWTSEAVRSDRYGKERSVGRVIAIDVEQNHSMTSGLRMPGVRSFANCKLSCITSSVTRGLDLAGTYQVTLHLMLSRTSGDADIANRSISLKAEGGASVAQSTVHTDAKGNVDAVFTCRKDQTARMSATFHNAKIKVSSSIAWLGPGDVTKIALLKGVPNPEVPTFLTPYL